MKGIKRVLVCVDMSDYSIMTIDCAVTLVRGLKAEIILLNVINTRDVDAVRTVSPYFPSDFSVDAYIEQIKGERQKKIREMIKEHFAVDQLQMSVQIEVGIPFEVILRAVDREKADLVVLANKGKSNLVGTLHGSNGERVFRHSPVPVLSVRTRERFSRNRQARGVR